MNHLLKDSSVHFFHLAKLIILSISFHSCDAQPTGPMVVDLSNKIIEPKSYFIMYTSEPILLDGKADDAAWLSAEYTDDFIDIANGAIPHLHTQVKMLWDDANLYIFAKLEEPHIAANITKHDSIIFHDKDFEVFIDPDGDTYNYFELEINALNTTWDLYLDRPYRVNGYALDEYEISGLNTAVYTKGTINEPSDIDQYWSVEIQIPITSVMPRVYDPVKAGDMWRMNFSRVHWDQVFENGRYRRIRNEQGQLKKEYNWVWTPQGSINMHMPEMWGFVYFMDENTNETYPKEVDLCDEQIAYAAFREMRSKPLKELRNKPEGYRKKIDFMGCENQLFPGEFIKTHKGFELVLILPKSDGKLIIDQNGYLTKHND